MNKVQLIKVFIINLLFYLLTNSCQKDSYQELFNEQKIFNSALPTDICFANKNIGYISGTFEEEFGTGVIAKTVDGGESWQVIPVFLDSKMIAGIRSIYAVSKDSVYATYSSSKSQGICFSGDGGNTWSNLVSFPIYVAYTSIIFTSSETSLVCGGGLIYKTKNNWNDWAVVYSSGGVGIIEFTDSKIGYSFGANIWDNTRIGYLVKTSDGGENWHEITNFRDCITCLKFINNTTGYAFTFQNDIFKTSDSGMNWSLLNNLSGFGESYYAIAITSRYKYFASGPSIFKTNDDFKTFSKVYSSTNLDTFLSVKAVQPDDNLMFFLSSEHSVVKIQINE